MKREFFRRVGEYDCVLRRAAEQGWLTALVRAHATPCEPERAMELLIYALRDHPCRVRFRPGRNRGRARYGRHAGERSYLISLPSEPGSVGMRLRQGLVLHEAAHVIQHARTKRFGHGETFTDALRPMIERWTRPAPMYTRCKSIYDNHPGKFSLVITRRMPAGKQYGDNVAADPPTAEATHDLARHLVTDPDGNVVMALVYSETEGSYVGLCYERGTIYEAWSDGVDVAAPAREDGAPVPGDRPEPLREVPAAAESQPAALVPAQPRAPRTRSVQARLRAVEGVEPWPEGDAQLVRALVPAESSGLTPAEITVALDGKTKCQVIASLVSRLKQKGLLEVVA